MLPIKIRNCHLLKKHVKLTWNFLPIPNSESKWKRCKKCYVLILNRINQRVITVRKEE